VSYLKRTKTQEACSRVTEIWLRWQKAVQYLGPIIESIPQVLILSILLFVLGLLDSLFSVSTQLDVNHSSFTAMVSASTLCTAVFVGVILILIGTIVHYVVHPHNSPFPSKHAVFTASLCSLVHCAWLSTLFPLLKWAMERFRIALCRKRNYSCADSTSSDWAISSSEENENSLADTSHTTEDLSKLSRVNALVYASILTRTYDDALIDIASSALGETLKCIVRWQSTKHTESMRQLLCFLLSPRASHRSVITAAGAIGSLQPPEFLSSSLYFELTLPIHIKLLFILQTQRLCLISSRQMIPNFLFHFCKTL
jgi:hypothetical protein